MSWIAILALAAIAFAGAVFVLRLPKPVWSLFGAALLFGLAGYAMQGSPGQSAAPRNAAPVNGGNGAQMVDARRQFFDADRLPSNWIVTADAFARRDDYARAAEFYGVAVKNDPESQEGWLALGMALVAHAEGTASPAADYAFNRALRIAPENGGAQYFLGLAALNGGDPKQARDWWSRALAAAPPDVPWREAVAFQNRRLGEMLEAEGPVLSE